MYRTSILLPIPEVSAQPDDCNGRFIQGVSDALRQHRRNTELYGLVVLHGPFSLTLRRHTVVSGTTARIPL